jgi:peptide/nickel transport system ATP-binding protein
MRKTSELLLEVRDLTVTFEGGERPALADVGFDLHRNEVLGIVGETGAGKSVLARSLINLLPPGGRITGGDVKLRGRSLRAMSAEEQRQLRGGEIALIGTNAKALLDPVRTVGSQIARVLRAHRKVSKADARRQAVELLASVGIVNPERRAEAYPHELSGGMAQRVVIAMAMIADPDIVLADDATLGLDATVQVQVLDLLIERCRSAGKAAVIITHDLGIVARFCDRVAIMKDGRVVENRPVEDFLAKPEAAYSASLLDAAKARPVPMTPRSEEAARAPGTDRPLLEVRNLLKLFPISGTDQVVRAIDDVSFKIGRGETIALVGESGSGKTTIGQCLVRLLERTGGQVLFDGEDITAMSQSEFRKRRHRIQMVFQEPYVALNPRWKVADLVSEPLQLLPRISRADKAKRVRELLDLVQLPARLADVYPHELTAGEQKRIGIARALATDPELVVFDEPTTALDIRVRAQIIDLVRDLQARMGLSALFITHDLNSVRSLAHYVLVMKHGKLVEIGETESIFANPQNGYTKTLLAAELPIEHAAEYHPVYVPEHVA